MISAKGGRDAVFGAEVLAIFGIDEVHQERFGHGFRFRGLTEPMLQIWHQQPNAGPLIDLPNPG